MEFKKVKSAYDSYLQKFPELPDLDSLDREIEWVDAVIERDEIPRQFLDFIRRKFIDTLGGWINYLHNFLLPNQQSMILVHESGNFSEEEKEHITVLLNKIMLASRISANLELQKDEKANAEFIGKYFSKWLSIKEEIITITSRNVIIWKEAIKKKIIEENSNNQYFG